ncbi:MAG: hypothetical protein SVM79_08545, partial [Chloroflexota bacterium]|nr:hypothetical protein [Chloroflexota bacterium]
AFEEVPRLEVHRGTSSKAAGYSGHLYRQSSRTIEICLSRSFASFVIPLREEGGFSCEILAQHTVLSTSVSPNAGVMHRTLKLKGVMYHE